MRANDGLTDLLLAFLTILTRAVGPSLILISEPTRRYAISYAVFCSTKKKSLRIQT